MNIRKESTDSLIALVERLIASQFPEWADLPVRPVDCQGNDNRTFRLGDELSVRLPSTEPYVAAVEKEHEWLPRLAPYLPLAIPRPVALGRPGEGYPWRWSVYRWLEGETASVECICNLSAFAQSLADFLAALWRVDSTGGPPAGQHTFFRGTSLAIYDTQTRRAITALGDQIDAGSVTEVWNAALAAEWHGGPVWFHGDVAATNLLTTNGYLSAVIDFGQSGVGDPACDLAIAWTFLDDKSREVFRSVLPADANTWARGRGWALWKALIVLVQHASVPNHRKHWTHNSSTGCLVIDEVIADHHGVVLPARL